MYSDQVNFDFEFSLFEKNFVQSEKNRKLNEEFEYIYFYCSDEKSCLCPLRKYDVDYLDYLSSLGIKLPKMDCSYPKRDWWGNKENIELARLLNSKITSTNIAQQNGLNPDGVTIVTTIEELSLHLKRYDIQKWICRDPYAMAGTNSLIFEKHELELNRKFLSKKLENSPLILAPYFYRLMDLGFIFEDENFSVTWNLNTKSGRFKGGIVFENTDSLSLLIKELFQKDFWEIFKVEKKVFEIFANMGNKEIIQIDSFFYKEKDLVKFYPLVEVNARKSMGFFINKLKKFLPKDGVGLFISLNTSNLLKVEDFHHRVKSLGDILYSPSNKVGVIPLSPIDGIFNTFFISADSLEKVDNLKHKLWNKISRPGEPLSPSFDFFSKK